MAKTTVWIPDKLNELRKQMKINLSALCQKALENEIYGDNPKYYETLIKEQNKKILEEQNKKNQYEKLYEEAKNQNELQKKRIISTEPEIRSYRTIIKPKKQEK